MRSRTKTALPKLCRNRRRDQDKPANALRLRDRDFAGAVPAHRMCDQVRPIKSQGGHPGGDEGAGAWQGDTAIFAPTYDEFKRVAAKVLAQQPNRRRPPAR